MAEREYLGLLEAQNTFWKQRAKQHWYVGGDQNSRFFHNAVKARKRKNQLKKLKDKEGVWVTEPMAMGDVMVDYFKELFSSMQGPISFVTDYLQQKITPSQNTRLEREVEAIEVRKALFDMHPEKSPGPDGLGPCFFQSYWDVVGPDVVSFCKVFCSTGKLPEKANNALIVLIPKKEHPETMMDLRPIALCNVLYKVAAKVLANRLKPLLGSLISENQSAFVPGRLISDNIMIAYEAHHYLKRKTQGQEGVVALKLDMSKAYDRVEWKCLEKIMLKY